MILRIHLYVKEILPRQYRNLTYTYIGIVHRHLPKRPYTPDDTPKPHTIHTIESLRLDVQAAMDGKHWLLLPEGFRDQESGKAYPLPSTIADLQKLIVIPIQPRRRDAGTVYVKRAIRKFRERTKGRYNKGDRPVDFVAHSLEQKQRKVEGEIRDMKAEAQAALDAVKVEAEKAIASMHDLFSLGREGIEGQMKAHLKGETWQGEPIDAKAFRECFRMVSQTVKGLGLPTDEQRHARDAIMEELAAALGATKEAMEFSIAPPTDPNKKGETEH